MIAEAAIRVLLGGNLMNIKKLTGCWTEARQRVSLRRDTLSISAILSAICMLALLLGPGLPLQASSGSSTGGVAPGGPGEPAIWTPANKEGFGTARSNVSKVWYTLQDGQLSEVHYRDLGPPGVRRLELNVSDGHRFAERAPKRS